MGSYCLTGTNVGLGEPRATRVEDWTCLGQHKRHPEFPVVTREKPRGSPVIAR